MKETRAHEVVGERAEFGRSTMDIKCPFCGEVTTAYKWSLAGSGKKCECGAKHTLMIDSFQGENRWLSNFWPCCVVLDGDVYTSTEAAYVAAKTTDSVARRQIREMRNTGGVKRFGRTLELRPGWEELKVGIMLDLLRQKFTKGSELGNKLAATGQQELIEGNTWGDTFWGICRGKGQNNLGKLLMQVRQEITSC